MTQQVVSDIDLASNSGRVSTSPPWSGFCFGCTTFSSIGSCDGGIKKDAKREGKYGSEKGQKGLGCPQRILRLLVHLSSMCIECSLFHFSQLAYGTLTGVIRRAASHSFLGSSSALWASYLNQKRCQVNLKPMWFWLSKLPLNLSSSGRGLAWCYPCREKHHQSQSQHTRTDPWIFRPSGNIIVAAAGTKVVSKHSVPLVKEYWSIDMIWYASNPRCGLPF